ncbi:unnamed protein product [Merluccius merluccius]
MRYRVAILAAGFSGLLSFTVLAAAIGTDYWYLVDVNSPNHTGTDDLSSHSGLWRMHEDLHKVVVVLLPVSLVLLVFGWIFGVVSALARSVRLLAASASYFLSCSLFTLSGLCIYISYSQRAMEEFQRMVSPEDLAHVEVSYGWSCALAWLSHGLEVSCGLLLLLAARLVHLKEHQDLGVTVAMT